MALVARTGDTATNVLPSGDRSLSYEPDSLDWRRQPLHAARRDHRVILQWNPQLLPLPLRDRRVREQLDREEVRRTHLVFEAPGIEERHRRPDPVPPVAHRVAPDDELDRVIFANLVEAAHGREPHCRDRRRHLIHHDLRSLSRTRGTTDDLTDP